MPKKGVDKLGKIFLISMIVLFIVTGVFGSIFFLVGSFGEVALRIFLTLLALFVYSLFGLASSKILKQQGWIRYLAIGGLVFSSIALILIMPIIWEIANFDDTSGKAIAICSIIAFSIAHISLLSGKMRHISTKWSFFVTISLIAIVAIILVYLVIIGGDVTDVYWRFLGFFGVLDTAGTIVTPLMRKLKG